MQERTVADIGPETAPDPQLDELVSMAEGMAAKKAPKKLPRTPISREQLRKGDSEFERMKADPERWATFQKQGEELEAMFPAEEANWAEKVGAGTAGAVAGMAKFPDVAIKSLKGLGVSQETLDRHIPNIQAGAQALASVGDKINQLSAKHLEDPRFAPQDMLSQAFRALGSSLPFGAGGLVRGAAMKAAVTATMGGAQNAVALYEDVLHETGDPAKAAKAMLLGFGIGTTEVVGVGGRLAKIDKATGGGLRKAFGKMVAKETLEEGIQEFVQTFANGIASDAISKEDVAWLQRFAESGQGAIIGAMVGAGVSAGVGSLGAIPGQPQHVPGSEGELTPEEDAYLGTQEAMERPLGGKVTFTDKPRQGAPGRTVSDIGPETAPGAAAEPKGASSVTTPPTGPETAAPGAPEEVAAQVLAGEDVPLEAITPEVVKRAVELREQQITPATPGLAPGEGQPSATQSVREPAGTDRGAGVSFRPEDIQAEEDLKGISAEIVNTPKVRRKIAGAISPELLAEAEAHPLTGLINRTTDEKFSRRVIAAAKHKGTRVVRFRSDIDNFKSVNDLLGHDVGDVGLKAIGDAWREATRGEDVKLAHIGGDEFGATIMVGPDADLDAIRDRMEKAAERALEKFGLKRFGPVETGVSIGYAESGSISDGEDAFAALDKAADSATDERKLAKGVSKARPTKEQLEEWRPAARADYERSRLEAAHKKEDADTAIASGAAVSVEKPAAAPEPSLDDQINALYERAAAARYKDKVYGDESVSDAARRLGLDKKIEALRKQKKAPTIEIRNLRTGKKTEIPASGELPKAPPAAPEKWTEIGKNAVGDTLYEDARGVRSRVSGGVRISEPVRLGPRGEILGTGKRGVEWEVTPTENDEPRAQEPAKPTKPATKDDEESLELESVKQARTIVRDARQNGGTEQEVFDSLLELYQAQPIQKARTSTSKEFQAFSTPLPLAWVASRLAGIDPRTFVYEPTAGHGALLIDTDPRAARANELDPARRERLKSLGFKPTGEDATEKKAPAEFGLPGVDVVIANPPFGKVTVDGEHKKFDAGAGAQTYKTKEIDHAIVFQSLKWMKDDGRAVFIVGGHKPFGDQSAEARTKAYRALSQQQFYKSLYENYNVTSHFTVDGKLYDRQGAAWPVDVIVIEGRGASKLDPPYKGAPRVLETWDEVRDLLGNDPLGAVGFKPEGVGGTGTEGQPEPERLPGPARGPRGAGTRGPRTGGGEGTPGGVGKPATGDGARRKPASEPGAELPGEERGPDPERGEDGGRGGVAAEGERPEPASSRGAQERGPADVAGVDVAGLKARGLENVNDFQAAYRPRSKSKPVDTLVPANMQAAVDRALARVEADHGGVDAYIAKKIGYSGKEVSDYFSAEQVDAIALAISNLENGAGFIIGDQTGVGKGRVVAAILRYAKRAGRIPVFVSKDPGLFADIRRDLRDIGMPTFSQFVTNTGLSGSKALELGDGQRIESLSKLKYAQAMRDIERAAADDKAPENFDAVFTTYDQMNTVKGATTPRMTFIQKIAPNSIFVLDESHEAGGTEAGPKRDSETGAVVGGGRSYFFRELVDAAAGVVYSSATYAKNPAVMTLYTKTNLGKAVEDRNELPGLVKAGGVPLQQAIASMLVEDGQYIRREKSFDGIKMELETAGAPAEVADKASELLRDIFRFDLTMEDYRADAVDKEAGGGGGVGVGDASVGEGGGSTPGFASVMHNVVAQMLLSLKARDVGRRAVAMLRDEGRKPVIALSNTMESLLDQYMEAEDLDIGDTVDGFTFGLVFDRYLERTRTITIKRPFSTEPAVKKRIEDDELPAHVVAMFDALKAKIAASDLGEMPGSPIDAIAFEMEKAGLRVGEITGRHTMARYDEDGSVILEARKPSTAAKKKAMRDFNNGDLDALVINRSGSTGFSLHAAPGNATDLRPRHMFIVQADANIDTFMQVLGRINRTGQIKTRVDDPSKSALPSYTVLISDVPAEKRPAAILMRKMASLNANTSASRTSAVSLKTAVDFMNEYGDASTYEVLAANQDVLDEIGWDLDKAKFKAKAGKLAHSATGMLPILPIARQNEILNQIEEGFTSRLEEAKEKGENLLEAEVLDLRAKTLSTEVLVAGTTGSAFTAPAYAVHAEVNRIGKPVSWAAVQAAARKSLKLDEGADMEAASRVAVQGWESEIDAAIEEARKKGQDAYKKLKDKFEAQPAENEAAKKQQDEKLNEVKERFSKLFMRADGIKERLRLLPGRNISLELESTSLPAYLVSVKKGHGSPLAPSNWTLTVATPMLTEGSGMLNIPISRMTGIAFGEDGYINVKYPGRDKLTPESFQAETGQRREKRWIITGNILAGFQKMNGNGQIRFYTDENGALQQGVLMPRGVSPGKVAEQQPVRLTPEQAIQFLGEVGGSVETTDGLLAVSSRGTGFPITFSAKTKGGKGYYLHRGARDAIGKDFESRRGRPTWEVYTDDEAAALEALRAYAADRGLNAKFITRSSRTEARRITGEVEADTDVKEGPEGTEMLAFPGDFMPDVRAGIESLAKKLGYIKNQKLLVHGIIPTETWTEHELRKWQDYFRGVKTFQRALGKSGGVIRDDTDTYLQEELRRGKSKYRLDGLRGRHIDPLLSILRKAGISPEEFGEALMARHARERNEVIRKRDPKNDAGSGFTDAEAEAIMERIENSKRAEGFAKAFARFDHMTEATRSGWVRDGLKSQEEVDALEKAYSFYAPLRSDMDEEVDDKPYSGTGRGVDVRGNEFKAALGRTTKAEARNVLAYAFMQAEQGIVRGEKNRVALSFLNLLRENAPLVEGFARISPPQIKRTLVNGVAKVVYDPRFKAADNVILVHENGEHVWVEIDKKYQNVADGLKNLGSDDTGRLVSWMGSVTRRLAAINTKYNPVFPLFNAIRDAGGAVIGSQEHGIAFAARTVRDIPFAIAALAFNKGRMAAYVNEYQASGAPVSFLDLDGYRGSLERIEKTVKNMNPRRLAVAGRYVLDAIGKANEIIENATRFSSYVHAREDLGMSVDRAASWAKNLTTNFERKGDYGSTVNAWWMFANAGIQSTARVGHALRNPGVRKLLVAGAMGLVAWDQVMRAIGGKDEDGEDCWDKIPSYVKRHNLIFIMPGEGGGCGRIITIPAPFTYDLVQTMAFQVSGAASGDIKPGAAFGEVVSAAFEAFDPIGSGELDLLDPASVIQWLSPTVLDPGVELASNRDWKGDPIKHDDFHTGPASETAFPAPTQASKAVAQWLNSVTGGDKYRRSGWADISPQALDHWGSFFTGGLGRTIAQAWDATHPDGGLLPSWNGLPAPRDVPFVSRLVRDPSPFASATDFKGLYRSLRIERQRAIDEKKPIPGDLFALWKEGGRLDNERGEARRAMDAMTVDDRVKAQRALDVKLQRFNARARKALLTYNPKAIP